MPTGEPTLVDRAVTTASASTPASLVHCPFCQAVLANSPQLAGQLARCPTCRNHFRMPGGQQVPVAQVVTTDLGNVNPAQIGQPQPAAPQGAASVPAVSVPAVLVVSSAPAPVASAPLAPGLPPLGFVKDFPVVPQENTPPTTPSTQTPTSTWVTVTTMAATPASLPIVQLAGVEPRPAPIDPATVPLLGEPPPTPLGPFPAVEPVVAIPVGEVPQLEEESDDSPVLAVARAAPAWLVSAVVHAVVLILLGMWVVVVAPSLEPLLVELSFHEKKGTQLDMTTSFEAPLEQPDTTPMLTENPLPIDEALSAPEMVVSPIPSNLSSLPAPTVGMALAGRGDGTRKTLVARYGGNEESESAVALGLSWLKEHQFANGSWNFRHTHCPKCNGKCRNPGGIQSETGATGLALLPFLGAGQTHKEGKYQETVRRGLYFLAGKVKSARPAGKLKLGREDGEDGATGDPTVGDLQSERGNMYCHGLAAIALCEAYGLTRDEGLKPAAQKALDFITYAQHEGGGWRYRPREAGDTSVFGWQLMALKSGHMSYLKVPPKTIEGAIKFLDHVQEDDGAYYGYTAGGNGLATTSIGLLSRMYLGWKKDNPALERGVKFLSDRGPSEQDMYHNYYATQVLHHYGGEPWKKWNAVMRDQLVKSQSRVTGHEEGSWWSPHHWSMAGGRLYETSLSVMTLEVYYRHLPIYKDDSVDREFGK